MNTAVRLKYCGMFAAVLLLAGGLATSAGAQESSGANQFTDDAEESGGSGGGPASGGIELVTASTFDLILASLQRNGFAAELTTGGDGDPLIQSTDRDQPFSIQFYGCTDGKDCAFIQFIKGWNMDDGITLAKIEEWNAKKVWTKAYRDDEKDPWLTHPINLFGGVTVENLDDSIDWWKVMVKQFEEHIGWNE